MDEHGRNGNTGDSANGAVTGATRWTNGALAEPTWARMAAATEPASDLADPTGHASAQRQLAEDDTAQWHVPGLTDETPAGGSPMVEPPLWREAARHAAHSSAPPASSPVPSAPPVAGSAPVVPPAPAPGASATAAAAAAAVTQPQQSSPAAPAPPAPRWGWPGTETAPSPWDRTVSHHANRVYPVPEAASGGTVTYPSRELHPATEQPVHDPDPIGEQPPLAPPAMPPDPELAPTLADLPQRVPSEPDVPGSGEPWRAIPAAEAPQLARIADQLRRDDVPSEGLSEGFDVDEVLGAVRSVEGVRAASLRASQTGAHTLRLDLADDADPVQVSGVVARLLQERMGLSAAPHHLPQQRAPQESPPAGGTVRDRPAEVAPIPSQGEEMESEPRSRPLPVSPTGPRVVIDQVQVNVVGLNATVEVRLIAGVHRAVGLASGPAIDSYVVRLAAVSAARAIDELIRGAGHAVAADNSPSRCFVEHTGLVPFGSTEVAVVVVLLVCGGWVEQLAGSAVVDGDARHAAVRATLGAVNRRLDALLA